MISRRTSAAIISFILLMWSLTYCGAQNAAAQDKAQPHTRFATSAAKTQNEVEQRQITRAKEQLRAEFAKQLEDLRASFQKQIAELKEQNVLLSTQLLTVATQLRRQSPGTVRTFPFGGQAGGTVNSSGSTPRRLRVIGSSRRDVYESPNGVLLGKVEPGAILRVTDIVTMGALHWYAVHLESGTMYPSASPNETLITGWVSSLAVVAVE